ncbi:hypothetical protein [Streptacidiphilus sp. EB103A]|jgi:plasmid stability protein|uniref:hypothetical protein n=1 Tax=Streptacidiphilus sp. EB103A TaxID=3156275 RepID=UPI003519AED7
MKQLNVRLDDEVAVGLEQRAAAAGMTLPEYARRILTEDADEQRARFLTAAAHFSQDWGPAFEAAFGPYPVREKDGRSVA